MAAIVLSGLPFLLFTALLVYGWLGEVSYCFLAAASALTTARRTCLSASTA